MKKKLLKYSISAAILAAMLQTTPTFASPIDTKVTQEQIDATQNQIDDFETKIQKLDNQISVSIIKSQKLNDHIKEQQKKIDATKAEIEKAKSSLEAHKKVYAERLKSIQSEGQQPVVTYAELLLSSNNISEFLTRFTAISEFIQSDTDLLNGLNEKAQALKNAEDRLHNELDNLKKSQAELAAEQKQIQENKQEVEKELANAKNNLQLQKDKLAQQQAEEKAQQEALEAQKRAQQLAEQQAQQAQQAQQQAHQTQQQATQQVTASRPAFSVPSANASGLADKVIATAEQYLGVPYVWGGSSPSGFDCSGLMQYVFHSVGVDLPRTAAEQQNVGTRISPNAVQPGDLVFMGTPAYHVGMYIGNGKWIQASETGDVVKISNYNPSHFSSAARVLQ